MSRYVEVCHCGCAKATHFEESGMCLGVSCDCTKYTDRDDPKPTKPFARPSTHPRTCLCFVCKQFPQPARIEVDDTVDTPRNTHPIACTCSVCAYMYGTP